MYNVFTGQQRSLVFPIMCNARIKLDYSDNVPDIEGTPADTTDDTGFGIYNHTGSFTFETIITPYDIIQNDVLTKNKIMPKGTLPANRQSEKYLQISDAITHEMRIFHSSNFQISLLNDVPSAKTEPSRYKIKVGIKLGSASMEYFTSDIVITSSLGRQFFNTTVPLSYPAGTGTITGFTEHGRETYFPQRPLNSAFSSGGTTLNVTSPSLAFTVGDRIYYLKDREFILIGTISSIGSSDITISSAFNEDIDSGEYIFIEGDREPTYINNSYHIACAYNDAGKTVNVYLNGALVLNGTHTQTNTFEFPKEDYFIGSNGSDATGVQSATTNNQFMGEMHEMCLTNVERKSFPYVLSLMPNYDSTLFYLRFEEIDL